MQRKLAGSDRYWRQARAHVSGRGGGGDARRERRARAAPSAARRLNRLAAADVRIVAGGGADATAGRITLPVTGVRFAATARLDHGGTLTFRKGKRAVALRALRTTLGRARVTAVVGSGGSPSSPSPSRARGRCRSTPRPASRSAAACARRSPSPRRERCARRSR